MISTCLILAATPFVACEGFEKLGGWTVETQSMRQLGSSMWFVPTGRVIWTLDSPGRLDSVSGVVVLEEEKLK